MQKGIKETGTPGIQLRKVIGTDRAMSHYHSLQIALGGLLVGPYGI